MIENPVPWPNGAKCAVAITFDMDSDSLIHLEHPADGISRVSGLSMLRYGPEVGVPRILETYKQLDIQQIALYNSSPHQYSILNLSHLLRNVY